MSWSIFESEIAASRRRRHGTLTSDPPRSDVFDADILPDPRGCLRKTVQNDPALFTLVKVRATRPFYHDGRLIGVGETISIPLHVANELQNIKVQRLT